MVSALVAAAAWFVAWTALAWLSMSLLRHVRPGETVPLRLKGDGTPGWRVSPGFAAAFIPGLATLVGIVTIGAGILYGRGQAPVANVALAAVFVAIHWMQVSTAVRVLERERSQN